MRYSKKSKHVTAAPAADTAKPKKPMPVAEKTKSSKRDDGLFTLYQDTITGSIQMYVKKDQLGKEFIYQSFSISGPTSMYLNQSMHRANFIFRIQKSFDKIEFATQNLRFYYDTANAVSRASNVDVPEAIFHSDKISAEDAGGYLVSMDGLFMSEKLDPIRPSPPPPGTPPNLGFNLGTLNPSKSKYSKVRSYFDNTDVIVDLAYDNPAPFNPGGKDITDPRYVRIRMQHTFLEIPKNDFRPRLDDPRVGYFTTETDDLTTTDAHRRFRDKIHRWHLVKKDPNAAISEPVQPIVFWVEKTTPVEYRELVRQSGLKWNEAFEKAGFRNAVEMRIMPDTATWDPSDVRYNVIRWVSSRYPAYGAIGPSFVNPRTGQILGSDITIEWIVTNNFLEELLIGNVSAASASSTIDEMFHKNGSMCTMAEDMKIQLLSEIVALAEGNSIDPAEEVKEARNQFLTYLVLHEMGHTLGLNHNMKASHMWSPKEINNKELTRKYGLYGSVMDYPAINIALDRKNQGDYYTTKAGPYDIWAIQYGYTPTKDEAEERKVLREVLSRSTDPKHVFGNDADDMRSPGKAIDPRVMINDLTSDPMTYAEDRFKLVDQRMKSLSTYAIKEDRSYYDILTRFSALNSLRSQMTAAVSRFIGGVYIDRSFPEQKSGNKPFTPVPLSEQKRAMNILAKNVFSPKAFEADAKVYPYLQQLRRGFNFFASTEDPKLTDMYMNQQYNAALAHLLHPVTLKRMSDSRLYGNQYSVASVMADLTEAIFREDLKTSVGIFRQNLQTEFVKQVSNIANFKTPGFDNITKAAALNAVKKIRSMLSSSVSPNEETRAHRASLIYIIDKNLERTM